MDERLAPPVVEASEGAIETFEQELRQVARALPERLDANLDAGANGLAQLVLTLVEVVRRVLEHQAIRRMDSGSLTEEQVERLGVALLRLDERMQELKGTFGLRDEDLRVDLGPLGELR